MIRLWRKLRAATPEDRALAADALVALLAARFSLWCLPFAWSRRVLSLYARRARGAAIPAERMARALAAVTRRLPEPFRDCLPQALAAEALLRRHGAPAELRVGVRQRGAGRSVDAHAWVASGGRVIVGPLEDLFRYTPLATGARRGPTRETLAALLRGPLLTWDGAACDPQAFIALCRAEAVSPLLYHRIRSSPVFASWPAAVRDALACDARAAVARELLIQRELLRVLDALNARGVRPVLFKGTALAYSRYAHPSLRSRSDTDLLIRPTDAGAVRETLSALDYAASLLCDGELLFRQFELARDDELGVSHALDVHWNISTQAAFAGVLPYEELAARAVAAPALGPNARVPAIADAMLLALVHPVMHHRNDQRLLWVYDVHLLAEALDPQGFDDLVRQAIEQRLAAVCAQGLRTARDWFGTAVPPDALDQLAAVPPSEQPTAAYLAPGRSWASETAANFRGIPRWRDRLRLLREIALPSPAYMLRAYGMDHSGWGKALLPALYLHRGVGGMWRVVHRRK